MLCPSNFTKTVNSISLNKISFIRSEKVTAGTSSIMVVFTTHSSNSKSFSLPAIGTERSKANSTVWPPKSLSFHDMTDCESGSPAIIVSSSTKCSLNLTFLVFRSLSG
ncbi:hypothetical protein ES288_A07G099100v1 [Gossypium darwinii]|uniref:Uncharacterized protein n=1 Tax=Gossypium darwinii TaxID=34276 RepID=A0A5D2FVV0_GOSDA|nr:hypothetical protein ES288_A07G099100v1 [Gossypium darwinii]